MMKHEAAALLTVAAGFDNRKPSPEAAEVWAIALEGLNPVDCREGIIAHYRASTEWIMPSHVRAEVKKIRSKRIADHPPIYPPAWLEAIGDADEFDRRYRGWLADSQQRIADGLPVESGEAPRAIEAGEPWDMPDLKGQFRALVAAKSSSEAEEAERKQQAREKRKAERAEFDRRRAEGEIA